MLQLARARDREAVCRIKAQIHALHVSWRPDIFRMEEDLYPEGRFLEDIRDRRIYVAVLGDEVLGYALTRIQDYQGAGMVPRRVMVLEELAVAELCRGQGFGSAILADVQALARAFGCTDLQLSVQPENEAALALYRKFGLTIRSLQLQKKL